MPQSLLGFQRSLHIHYSFLRQPAVASKLNVWPYTLTGSSRRLTVRSPVIGRGFALALIFGLLFWTAVRSIGARPPATPRIPFPKPAMDEPLAAAKGQESAGLPGGCFLGTQRGVEPLKGGTSVTARYYRGRMKSPTYQNAHWG